MAMWALILIISGHGAPTFHDYTSKENCIIAGEATKKAAKEFWRGVEYVCSPK